MKSKKPKTVMESLYQNKTDRCSLSSERNPDVVRFENGDYTFKGKSITEEKFRKMLESGELFWMNWEARYLVNHDFDYDALSDYLTDARLYDEY